MSPSGSADGVEPARHPGAAREGACADDLLHFLGQPAQRLNHIGVNYAVSTAEWAQAKVCSRRTREGVGTEQ